MMGLRVENLTTTSGNIIVFSFEDSDILKGIQAVVYPTKSQPRHRDRVPRACRNCHKRKVKCSGGLPRCDFCEKVNKPCIYEATRKDRLAAATDRNEHLVSLLRDLTGRVDDDDRARIESALNDSDDNDYDSPVPGTVGRPSRLQSSSYSQYSDFSRHQSRSQTSPLPTLYKPETNTTSPAPGTQLFSIHQGSNYDAESLSEYAARSPDTHEAGYLGQICEVQWLRSLKQRLQIPNLVPPAESPKPSETNFYLDDNGIRLLNRDNPFHLPPESQATLLSQCYFQTVHVTFPIIASEVESQLQIYYHSVLSGRPVMFPQSWYAVINFVLAIGARFSHITNAEWHLDPLDEMVYISRAFQLLGLNDTGIVLSAPDLPLIQATGLLAFYYMTIGHVSRAWITVGIALRAAVTSGLHTQSKYSSSDPNLNQATLKTWWSLYNLESLLGSMVGRPCMLQGEEVTTPLLSEVTNPQHQKEPIQPRVMAYSDAQVRLAMIAQKTLRKLYTERRTARSWSQIHTVITSLMQELDDWASEVMPQYNETPHAALNYDMKQMMLRNQYCRMKILITRPALRRIERCSDAGTEDFTAFDQEAAEACIQTAQDMSALLPENLEVKILYEKSPWWTIIHNITQALSILIISMTCRQHFEPSYLSSVASVKKLVTWLQYLREHNNIAQRAYQVIHSIVKSPHLANPAIWKDIADMFPDEVSEPPTILPEQMGLHTFHSWSSMPAQELTSEYHDAAGFYHLHSS